ncbi:MAG: type VI secretion system baseplate subunit TssF [Oceanospirillaceae bacterium]|nr:type VI secretion system baseplate subunit TssF [Oceanospirillaceae bacterium]
MAFNKYYLDELSYLREMGSLFSQQNPGLSRYLSEEGQDPDVERLFEGFAFLTGRLRQKLDDELPEVTHSLINLLWPHYLRPIPSMSILEFYPIANALTDGQTIKQGATIQSVEVEGTNCQFRTCYDVDVYPMEINDVSLENQSDGSMLEIDFDIDGVADTATWGLDEIMLYLHGDREGFMGQALYLWLFRYLDKIELKVKIKGQSKPTRHRLSLDCLQPEGFSEEQELIPYGNRSFRGYRYLQEYFSLPEKFLFIKISKLKQYLAQPKVEGFTLCLHFEQRFDAQMRIRKEHIRLNCTPIVNLFEADCDPISIVPERMDYPLRPTYKNQQHIELYSVDSLFGKQRGRSESIKYPAYESFDHVDELNALGKKNVFYKLRRSLSTLQSGLDTSISFVEAGGRTSVPNSETISIELTCTNRRLPETLRAGDVTYPTANSPEFVTFKNITRVTQSIPPPLNEGLHWMLISQMALHYRSMSKVESIRVLLKSYDFRAFHDRQAERTNKLLLDSIHSVKTEAVDRMHMGTPVRGLKTTLELWESKYGAKGLKGESGMFVFASVLNGFFAQYANVNAFHELEVKGLENGETYKWVAQPGQQHLL